jgi:hypothetical protein
LLEVVDFGEQGGGFLFKKSALDLEVFLGIFAGFELEVEVAQVFVKLLLAFVEVVETGFLALGGKDVLGPEGVDKEGEGEGNGGNFALECSH